MYQYSYSEVLADSPVDARAQERMAFDHAIVLLQVAETAEPGGPEQQSALDFVNQLWGLFIKDLASPENDLPAELRAQLMSVGLWIMAETQRIHIGQSRNLRGIADVCALVRDGLA